ncbi:MarR family winged helix-turn-helix transcriptional regulator [Melioribacter sp. OK-6-Me]|uniref:MarR family winged helix-turn-helix transcriptional regulator n=1 Tax=unclassified Melioribacter TaxID=2627329 RepID=UPI003ED87947
MSLEKTEAALKLIEKLSRTADKIRKVQAKYVFEKNLTAPQFAVLEILSRTGPVPLKRISDEMMVTGANITCVVDNLEKEGFVRRIHSKEDRRVILGELTPEGRKKVESILPEYTEKLANLTSGLTESEQKQLSALLDKLLV